MPAVSERRRQPRRKAARADGDVCVLLENVPGASGAVRAKLVDSSDAGMGVEASFPIPQYAGVIVRGEQSGAIPRGKVRARVVRCTRKPDGQYCIGLIYEGTEQSAEPPAEPVADYYEVLQVNPKADPEMIHRVYRLLAQRFHPDNGETGNAEMFRGILEAYKVLSDPEKRAAYDVHLQAYRSFRWRLFEPGQAAVGKQAEKSKRHGILALLYTARLNHAAQPSMSIHEIEELLGCPREHLEFSLWYLKENSLVVRSDNGRFAITALGVDRAEAEEAAALANNRLLPAG